MLFTENEWNDRAEVGVLTRLAQSDYTFAASAGHEMAGRSPNTGVRSFDYAPDAPAPPFLGIHLTFVKR
jgi:hypothetical protein